MPIISPIPPTLPQNRLGAKLNKFAEITMYFAPVFAITSDNYSGSLQHIHQHVDLKCKFSNFPERILHRLYMRHTDCKKPDHNRSQPNQRTMKIKIESAYEVRKRAYRPLYEQPAKEVYAKQDTWGDIRVSKWLLEECDEHVAVFETRQSGLEVVELLRKSIEHRIRNGETVKVTVYKTIGGKQREIVLADVSSKNVDRCQELYEFLETRMRKLLAFENPAHGSEEAKVKGLMYDMYIVVNNLKRLMDNGYEDPAFVAAQEAADAKYKEWQEAQTEVRISLQEPIDATKAEMAELGINMDSAHWLLNQPSLRQ